MPPVELIASEHRAFFEGVYVLFWEPFFHFTAQDSLRRSVNTCIRFAPVYSSKPAGPNFPPSSLQQPLSPRTPVSVIPLHLFAYLSLSLLVWHDYTQAVQAWRRGTKGIAADWLASIMNFFLALPLYSTPPPSKSGFESRRRRSTAVIVLESWLDPCARLACHKTADWERRTTGKRAGSSCDGGRRRVGLEGNKEAAELLAGNYEALLIIKDSQRVWTRRHPSVSHSPHTHTHASTMTYYRRGNHPSRLQSRSAREQSI